METSSSPPPPPTTTTTTATAAVKTLDPDTRIQPKHLPPPPFSNGVLKRHQPRHHNLHHPTPVVITYRECLKNHAASIGGHAVDGCGEFMPSPASTPADPTSLKCAACGCHRNFHRRDPDESPPFPPPPPQQHLIEYQPHHRHHPPHPISLAGNSPTPPDSPSPPPISSSYYPSAPHMLLALSSGGLSGPPPPENNHNYNNNHPSIPITPGSGSGSHPNGKKRFRTKFSQDQKEKMQELAERVGWKMQKRDEDLIIGFCNEIGVEKGVFKVWMHNNKMNLGTKKDSGNGGGGCGGGGGIDFLSNRDNEDNNNNHHHHHDHHELQRQHQNNDSLSSGGGGGGGNVIGTNGSSSSS